VQLLAMLKKICANQRSLLSIKIHLEGAELGSIGSIVCGTWDWVISVLVSLVLIS